MTENGFHSPGARASRCILFFFLIVSFFFCWPEKEIYNGPGQPGQVEKERYNGICQLAEPKKKDTMGLLSWPSRKKRYTDIAEPAKNKNSSGRRLDTVFPLYGEFTEKDTMTAAQKKIQ